MLATTFAQYAGLELFFMFLGAVATAGITIVVAILDREWSRDYEPAHRIPRRYVGAHRAPRRTVFA